MIQQNIDIGYQTFSSDGGEEFGAVRRVMPDSLVVYVENAGDFVIPEDAVEAVHYQKVIVNCDKLGEDIREAIRHAHDDEDPGIAAVPDNESRNPGRTARK